MEGNKRADMIMAHLSFVSLKPEHFNRIYEAVEQLPDGIAVSLVRAIRDALEGKPNAD